MLSDIFLNEFYIYMNFLEVFMRKFHDFQQVPFNAGERFFRMFSEKRL